VSGTYLKEFKIARVRDVKLGTQAVIIAEKKSGSIELLNRSPSATEAVDRGGKVVLLHRHGVFSQASNES
jgi:hypothetical protein